MFISLFVAVIKHPDQKTSGAERIHLTYTLRSQSIVDRSQGKELRRERDAEAMDGLCLLAGSLVHGLTLT